MSGYNLPQSEENNPFYCPDQNASLFLESLRQKTRGDEHELRLSFNSSLLQEPVDFQGDFLMSSDEYSSVAISPWDRNNYLICSPLSAVLPRCLDTFSDLEGSIKPGLSEDYVNYDSFELSGKADKLHYSYPDLTYSPPHLALASMNLAGENLIEKFVDLEVKLYGPRLGPETPQSLAILYEHLEFLLPGIRLKERLNSIKDPTHQKIVDFLAADGHLSARVLGVFRMSEIDALDLSCSMLEHFGLNLAARDLLKVFTKPNSFLFVSYIAIENTPVPDFDLVNIHHLPRLSALSLCNTAIGNEAICHLVALKYTLRELYVEYNPRIDDNAIGTLILLKKLTHISIIATGIGIIGLRRFALEVFETDSDREITPVVNHECIDYPQLFYTIDIDPPLIVDPDSCKWLSVSVLRLNLEYHASQTEGITVTGTKEQMITRLEEVLTRRKEDMLVVRLLTEEAQRSASTGV